MNRNYTFDKDKFKKGNTPEARAEMIQLLYAIQPENVIKLFALQDIDISEPLEFDAFINLYLDDKIKFDFIRFAGQMNNITPAMLVRARAKFAPVSNGYRGNAKGNTVFEGHRKRGYNVLD